MAMRTRLIHADLGEIEVVFGSAGTVRVATLTEANFVVSAIVGVAGLEATYEAVCAGNLWAWPTKNAWSLRVS